MLGSSNHSTCTTRYYGTILLLLLVVVMAAAAAAATAAKMIIKYKTLVQMERTSNTILLGKEAGTKDYSSEYLPQTGNLCLGPMHCYSSFKLGAVARLASVASDLFWGWRGIGNHSSLCT